MRFSRRISPIRPGHLATLYSTRAATRGWAHNGRATKRSYGSGFLSHNKVYYYCIRIYLRLFHGHFTVLFCVYRKDAYKHTNSHARSVGGQIICQGIPTIEYRCTIRDWSIRPGRASNDFYVDFVSWSEIITYTKYTGGMKNKKKTKYFQRETTWVRDKQTYRIFVVSGTCP